MFTPTPPSIISTAPKMSYFHESFSYKAMTRKLTFPFVFVYGLKEAIVSVATQNYHSNVVLNVFLAVEQRKDI